MHRQRQGLQPLLGQLSHASAGDLELPTVNRFGVFRALDAEPQAAHHAVVDHELASQQRAGLKRELHLAGFQEIPSRVARVGHGQPLDPELRALQREVELSNLDARRKNLLGKRLQSPADQGIEPQADQ